MTNLRKILLAMMIVLTGYLVAGPLAAVSADQAPTAPCYDGITPLNPYANNCNLPSRPPRVRGSAPDQTALINCGVGSQAMRALCISQYVNGGGLVVPGYRP